jgi:hypothetical protein
VDRAVCPGFRPVPFLLLLAPALPLFPQPQKAIFPTDTRPFTQSEDHDLIQTVCPGHTEKSGKVECGKNCPSSTGLDGGEHIFDWTLVRVTLGHFLSPTSEDAVVSTDGCEPHASNWGGSVLLTRRAEKWRMIWYTPGLQTSRCHKVQLKGSREILVCLGESGGQRNIWAQIYAEDIARPQPALMGTDSPGIFEVLDDTAFCATNKPYTLKHAVIEKVEFTDVAMSVVFSQGARPTTPADAEACKASRPKLLPPMHRYRMDFLFDGHNYKPTPSSAALAKRLDLR